MVKLPKNAGAGSHAEVPRGSSPSSLGWGICSGKSPKKRGWSPRAPAFLGKFWVCVGFKQPFFHRGCTMMSARWSKQHIYYLLSLKHIGDLRKQQWGYGIWMFSWEWSVCDILIRFERGLNWTPFFRAILGCSGEWHGEFWCPLCPIPAISSVWAAAPQN